MAPIRRYLRITKYSVLECRIYLDNPALANSWLLRPRDPVLPRVIESVRPWVLPKLQEEKELALKKKGKKKTGPVKDVVVEDDFEVSLFLIETDTRHSMLYKHRRARDKTQTRLVSNSSKLTGGDSLDAPIDVEDDNLQLDLGEDRQPDDEDADIVITAQSTRSRQPSAGGPPNILREDSDEEAPAGLDAIPDIREAQAETAPAERRSKRRRHEVLQVDDSDAEDDRGFEGQDSDDDSLFNDDPADENAPPSKRQRAQEDAEDEVDDADDVKKKKLIMDVSYEGFAIYGRVLCLVVKQRGPAPTRGTYHGSTSFGSASTPSSTSQAKSAMPSPAGQAAMANWIASTQVMPGVVEGDA